MKKYLIAFVAIIFAIGLNSFTTISQNLHKNRSTPSHWFEYNAGSSTVGSYLDYGERSSFTEIGCESDEGPDCRRGYPENLLVDPNDPDLGVTNKHGNIDEIQVGE